MDSPDKTLPNIEILVNHKKIEVINAGIRLLKDFICRLEPCLQPCPHISHLDITFIK